MVILGHGCEEYGVLRSHRDKPLITGILSLAKSHISQLARSGDIDLELPRMA